MDPSTLIVITSVCLSVCLSVRRTKIVIFVTSEAQFLPRTSASARVGEPKLRLPSGKHKFLSRVKWAKKIVI